MFSQNLIFMILRFLAENSTRILMGGIIVDNCYESCWNVIYNYLQLTWNLICVLTDTADCWHVQQQDQNDDGGRSGGRHGGTSDWLLLVHDQRDYNGVGWTLTLGLLLPPTFREFLKLLHHQVVQSRSSTARRTSLRILWDEAVVLDWRHWIRRHYAFCSGVRWITNIQYRGRVNEIRVCSYLVHGASHNFVWRASYTAGDG